MNGARFACSILLVWSNTSPAEDQRLIEEIIVTAQRIEENANKVPISVSAFTDAMLQDRQIIGISDLQLNVPNFSYSRQNLGGGRISIRGVGDLFLGTEGSQAKTVPFHINGISAPVDCSEHRANAHSISRTHCSKAYQPKAALGT